MHTRVTDIHAVMEAVFQQETRGILLEDAMVRFDRPGHTREIAHLGYCHEGRHTAHYYTFGTMLGQLDERTGLEILRELAKLQITDTASPSYGGFRWYREERQVNDTNAAFFILRPLVILAFTYPEVIPASHWEVISQMLRHAGAWFSHECREPILYYPNKIISDGAMLLAISHLLHDETYLAEGIAFFEKWEDYTARRGWGWGENISLVYLAVILNALQVASKVFAAHGHGLEARMQARIEEILNFLRFHDGQEMVPTIRSYNFAGETVRFDLAWAVAGVAKLEDVPVEMLTMNHLLMLLMFKDRLPEALQAKPAVPRVRVDRVFDESAAYSWIGRTTRLGSLNRFPVIKGSYQWQDWGLGWQSFPVSFSVAGEQVSYLRWYVDLGDEVRTHPGETYRVSYLKPALFRETYFPGVETRSAQHEHCLLTVRSMDAVNHHAAELADEWVIHRFTGELAEIVTAAEGRTWYVLRYPHTAVAVTALSGIRAGEAARGPIAVTIEREAEPDRIKLRQVLWRGEAGTVQQPRLEAGWAVISLEAVPAEDIDAYLEQVRIEDRSFADGESPRTPSTYIRDITMKIGGRKAVHLQVDPYQ
ncbi:hypothetical protein ABE504_18530 [Paenibacillus oryzisoli]|uniref:hypothetical protein n=1 Tax=Paenibacillus oryzisoli TaxID=1850517 RepID=UPI003D2D0093